MNTLFILLCLFFPALVFAQSYGTFTNPCAATSLRNTRFQTGAAFVANPNYQAGPGSPPIVGVSHGDWITIVQASNSDPLRTLKRRVTPTPVQETNYCSLASSGWTTYSPTIQFRLPDAWTYANEEGNGIAVVCNSTTASCFEAYLFERCDSSYNQYPNPGSQYGISNVYGMNSDCSTTTIGIGGHRGTKLSAFWGTVRSGELTTAPGVPIPHVLSIHLCGFNHSFPNDGTRGYRWPATAADGFASEPSTGYTLCNSDGNPACSPTESAFEIGVRMDVGSLNCNSLRTEPGKKLCTALRDYGGYTTDTSRCAGSSGSWGFAYESQGDTTSPFAGPIYTVHNEVLAAYGINLRQIGTKIEKSGANCGGNYDNAVTCNLKLDLNDMFENLRACTNCVAAYPAGPARPSISTVAFVDSTHTDFTFSAPHLTPLQIGSAPSGLGLTDNGTPLSISAIVLQSNNITVRATHNAWGAAGTRLASYTEVGSGNTRVRTQADVTGVTHEAIGFTNKPVTGDTAPANQLVCYKYTGATLSATDESITTWGNVPGTQIGASKLVEGSCWNGCDGEVKCLRDATHLWLLVRSADSDICLPSGGLPYRRDTMEVFLDGANNGGAATASDNCQLWAMDSAPEWQPGVTAGGCSATNAQWWTSGSSRYWKVQIPWSDVDVTPSDGLIIGGDIRIENGNSPCDDTRDGAQSLFNDAAGGDFTGLGPILLSASTITLVPDDPAPGILFVSADPITGTTAQVNVTTDETATCIIDYEIAPFELPYDNATTASPSGTTHTRTLTSLTANSTYTYRVRCSDGTNETIDANRTFTTAGALPPGCTITQTRYRFLPFGEDPETSTFRAEENTPVTVRQDGSFATIIKIATATADCAPRAVTLEYATTWNGAGTDVGADCTTADICFDARGGGIHLAPVTTERLTSDKTGTFDGLLFSAPSGQLVLGVGSQDKDPEYVFNLMLKTSLSPGTVRYLRIKGLNTYTEVATPKITIVNPALVRTGGGILTGGARP